MTTTRNLTIEHEGVTYDGRIATIKSTRLGYEDHGILTAYLHVEWKGGGVGVGGYCLDQPKNRGEGDYSRRGTAYGLDHLIRLMETVGVHTWEQLAGKQVIVLFEGESAWGNQSLGIASTTDESKVFILKAHADEWRNAEARS